METTYGGRNLLKEVGQGLAFLSIVVVVILILATGFGIDPIIYLTIVGALIGISSFLTAYGSRRTEHRLLMEIRRLILELLRISGISNPIPISDPDELQTQLTDYDDVRIAVRNQEIDMMVLTALEQFAGEFRDRYRLLLWRKVRTGRLWSVLGAVGATDAQRNSLLPGEAYLPLNEPQSFDLRELDDENAYLLSLVLALDPQSLQVLIDGAEMLVLIPLFDSEGEFNYVWMLLSQYWTVELANLWTTTLNRLAVIGYIILQAIRERGL